MPGPPQAPGHAERNPYVGPRPFERTDADRFFGRDRETRELLSLVISHRIVLLYAASGAGKTSLLNASLLPLLEQRGFDVLPPGRVRAPYEETHAAGGNVYVASLLAHLEPGLAPSGEATSLAGLLTGLPHEEGPDGFAAPRALVVDQFEEIFTAYPQHWQDRPGFFDALAEAVESDPLVRIVLAIREDFLAQLDPYLRQLPGALRGRYRLERLGRDAALRAVTAPLTDSGRAFDEGVAERLVDDLLEVRVDTGDERPVTVRGEYVEPVALQVACRSLWEALPAGVTLITEEHRSTFGNVDEVLASFYDHGICAAATAARMREGELRARFERAFVTPLGTRGTVVSGREETAGIPAAAIAELDRRHLIRAELRAGARWYELTHDRLIEPLRASNRRRAARIRRRRVRELLVAAAALGAAAAVALGSLVAVRGGSRSVTVPAPVRAPSQQALESIIPVPGGPVGAPTLTADGGMVAAVGSDGVAREWTRRGIPAGRVGTRRQPVSAAVFARGGVLAVAPARQPPELLLSDSGSLASIVVLGDRGPALALSVSADGRRLAAGFADGSVHVFAVDRTPTPLVEIPAGSASAPVAAVSFSPSTRLLAVQDQRGQTAVWQLDPPRLLRTFGGRTPITRALFVDDRTVALQRADGTAELRATLAARTTRLGRGDALAVSPARHLVALARPGGTIDLANAAGVRMRRLHTADVRTLSLAFSPDGGRIAAGGRDGVVRLFALASGRETPLTGQLGSVTALSFSGDGAFLASAARDNTIRIWRALPDLTLSARLVDRAGKRKVVAQVRNRGAVAADSVFVSVNSVDLTSTVRVRLPALVPGAQRTLTIPLGPAAGQQRYRVSVDTERAHAETGRGNNVVTVGRARTPTPAASGSSAVRQQIVAAALLGVRKARSIHYSAGQQRMQGVLARIRPPHVPAYADSSSFVTWCYWQAGAPDPNGFAYNGFGYTGTLATHGRRVAEPVRGDVVLYGSGSVPAIAGIYVGGGKVAVNGGESGPDLRPIDFRSPRQIRRYLEEGHGSVR